MTINALRRSWFVTAAFGALFVFSVASAILESREALNYREIRAASTQLELAAHTLTMIELIDEIPEGIELEQNEAVDLLENDRAFEETGLDEERRERAIALTAMLTGNAGTDAQTSRVNTEELLQILHDDTITADALAKSAERSSFQFILLSAATGLVIVLLMLSTQRRERELKGSLRSQAYTDFLTGLPNRRELNVCLDIARHELTTSPGSHAAMLFMDLDGFKEINDTGGHAAGDDALRVVAAKLRAAEQPGETLMRLGGDEFGVVMTNVVAPEEALAAADRYRQTLTAPSKSGDVIHVSIGVATTDDVDRLDDLQTQSNLAMYRAKERQGSSVALYKDELRETINTQSTLLRALRNADLDQEFFLEYQPVVSVDVGEVFFVEALVRWEHPSLGRVGPNEFIPLAERSGEITRIGEWVIQNAFRQLSRWQKDPFTRTLSISVNVSIHELEDGNFIDRLLSAAANAGGIDPAKLIIEVTESSATGPLAMRRLADIQSLGYRVAIDDFGSGYSNLAQLIHTPFDILKIDRELIASLEKFDANGHQAIEVLQAVSAIARTQGAPVVCEGVEETQQLRPLRDAGVSHIQGWLVSKAVSPNELRSFLHDQSATPLAA